MRTLVDLFVPVDEFNEIESRLDRLAERALGWQAGTVGATVVVRRSLDARKGRPLGFRLRCQVATHAAELDPRTTSRARLGWPSGRSVPRVVVIGSGPAGSWAALRLAEAGVPVTIVERGNPVQPRRTDLARLTRGQLNPESNYCFGEGGAGTFSDGKLYTRTKDRAAVAEVLADLVELGAPADVQIDAHPHVGSNRLPRVLTALRAHLETIGVGYRFGVEVTGLRLDRGRVRAACLSGGDEIAADIVVLAAGHSSRSVYDWAHRQGLGVERKSFAVGVRIEHPQSLIDEIQYGAAAGHPSLPPASYDLRSRGSDRGVYSFCMCPGGWIVPAATEVDGVVVNGMSLSKRDSPYANSGFVVSVGVRDLGLDGAGPLAGVAFQRDIERAAFRAGGGQFTAPAQRLTDFLANRPTTSIGKSSYRPGLTPASLDEVLPGFVIQALRDGLREIGQRVGRFVHPDAVLIAAETRTSSPVRILRDAVTLESPGVVGLYPAGEGAGYAGGIVSAALDGVRVAQRIVGRR
jgi:uncharacterized FAD-dependent dehydrogenase